MCSQRVSLSYILQFQCPLSLRHRTCREQHWSQGIFSKESPDCRVVCPEKFPSCCQLMKPPYYKSPCVLMPVEKVRSPTAMFLATGGHHTCCTMTELPLLTILVFYN